MSLTRPMDKRALGFHKRRKHFLRKHAYAREFQKRSYDDIAEKLMQCQESEVLACCSHCGKSWWIVDRCRLRVCPLCSYEVAMERAKYLKAMTKHMQHPKMLTLTMARWTGTPALGIDYLRRAFNKLRRSELFKAVVGGAYNIELKPKEDGWHVHMHVLLDAPYLPYQQIFSAWRGILKEKCPQVDIRSASEEKAKDYIVKDASKSVAFETNPAHIVDWYEATKGKRLFATFGKWYNAKIEDLDDDLKPKDLVAKCPYCGMTKTVFLARDGPWIYGPDSWRDLGKYFLGSEGDSRRIDVAEEYIVNAHPELDEPREETTK